MRPHSTWLWPRYSKPSIHDGGGGVVHAEKTGLIDGKHKRPDILVLNPGGLPVVVETEFMPASSVEEDARLRLNLPLKGEASNIEQAIALRAPASLKKSRDLEEAIHSTKFEICVYSEKDGELNRWPKQGWLIINVDELATAIELAALSENRLSEGMMHLMDGVKNAASILLKAGTKAPNMLDNISQILRQEKDEQTWKMAMAIIVNALTFHKALEGSPGFEPIAKYEEDGTINHQALLKDWEYIYKNINYLPIFKTATILLKEMKSSVARAILAALIVVADKLDSLGTTSQNSLNGRMFQSLITDRKFLATFYTLPSSAAFLAELAASRLDRHVKNAADIKNLRIADFACGTGALLSAVYNALMSRCRRRAMDDEELHAHMMEQVLAGTDIMPAASHLTVSMLASAHPGKPFKKTPIATLPYGNQPQAPKILTKLGALDLIVEDKTGSIFDTGNKRVLGIDQGESEDIEYPHESFDLVIMNPPFTRPTGHSKKHKGIPVPSFAAFQTSKDEQRAMSKKLKKIARPGMAHNGNAGLAADFIDLAHAKVKPGGVVALVLPLTFIAGPAWRKARELLGKHYQKITIISIASNKAKDCAFSADTGMAETLVIATRNSKHSKPADLATFISIASRPQTVLEAVAFARAIEKISPTSKTGEISIGGDLAIGAYSRKILLQGTSAVQETSVAEAGEGIYQGMLCLPRQSVPIQLPITKLEALGNRGLYHMDINGAKTDSGRFRGPLEIVAIKGVPEYPVLWGHDGKNEARMVLKPDKMGKVREDCKKRAAKLWEEYSSRLHFNRDFSLGSQPLAACLTAQPAIGGRAWPSFLCKDPRWEIPIVLWANTSLGLISFWWKGTRQQPGRTMIPITQLPQLAVLDPRDLTPNQFECAQEIFNEFKNKGFLPAYKACVDQSRKDLDEAIIVKLLGKPRKILDALDLLRHQWCAEPSVHGSYEPANAQD